MLDRVKAWNDRTRLRNQARAERMNAWMDTHGPNTWSPEAAAARAADPGAVASFAGVSVYPDRILRDASTHGPADEQPAVNVSATVVTGGSVSSRATLTRSLVPGMHGWQKEVDHREAQLVVDGPTFQWVIPIRPDQADKARQFAATITSVGRQASV
jgi:hypothetical protein